MQFAVVARIHRADHGLVVLRSRPTVVFRFADEVFREAGIEFFVLRGDAVDDLFDEAELVAFVKNGEIIFVADLVGIRPEDSHAEGMECGCSDFIRLLLVEHSADTLLHLSSGFVGEGDGQDFRGRCASRYEPSDASHDGASFSGSRAR